MKQTHDSPTIIPDQQGDFTSLLSLLLYMSRWPMADFEFTYVPFCSQGPLSIVAKNGQPMAFLGDTNGYHGIQTNTLLGSIKFATRQSNGPLREEEEDLINTQECRPV